MKNWHFLTIVVALIFQGCGEDGWFGSEDENSHGINHSSLHVSHAKYDYVVANEWDKSGKVDHLRDSSNRIALKRAELQRIVTELDSEQKEFQSDLQKISVDYAQDRAQIMSQYAAHASSMREFARFQESHSKEAIHVDTGRGKSNLEVWVDPESVSSVAEQRRLDQLVLQETRARVSLGSNAPSLFSMKSNRDSRQNKVRVFHEEKTGDIKLMATCGYKRFRKHAGERFFLSFTCSSTSSSFSVLSGDLLESVMHVVCRSKQFARKLVLKQQMNRCAISQWWRIAEGIDVPKFSKFDRKGKRAWNALKAGSGCFSKNESNILSTCTNHA